MPQTNATRNFLGALESERVGFIYGPDEAERLVKMLARTYHLRIGSLKIGGHASVKSSLDYALRRGEYAKPKPERIEELRRRVTVAREGDDEDELVAREKDLAEALELDAKADELEFWAGDYDAVRRAAELIEASAIRREGPFAERLVVMETSELPADTDEEQRAACAEAIVADWNARHGSGHPAVAAVHCNGLVQPHIHVLASARPIREDGTVDRSVRLWAGPHARKEMQEERERMADIINRTCEPEVLFHHGRLAATHIYREPRKRIAGYALQEARARMGADPGRAGEIEAEMHAASMAAKAEKSEAIRRRREEREREKREKPVKKARAALERAEEARDAARARYDEIVVDNAPVPEPAELNERERERLVKRLGAGGRKDEDPTDARTQATGFALLRLDQARVRLRKRRKELDAALAGEETLRRLAEQVSGAARAEAAAAAEDDEARRQELEGTARIERALAAGPRDALTARLSEAVGAGAAAELVAAFEAQQESAPECPAPQVSSPPEPARGTVEASAGDAPPSSPSPPASGEQPGAEMPEPLPEEQRQREAELRKRHSGLASLRKGKERDGTSPSLAPDKQQAAAAGVVELGERLAALEKEMEASRGGKDPYAMRSLVELGAAWRKEGKRLEDEDSAVREAAERERDAIRREAALRSRDIEEASARQEAQAIAREQAERRAEAKRRQAREAELRARYAEIEPQVALGPRRTPDPEAQAVLRREIVDMYREMAGLRGEKVTYSLMGEEELAEVWGFWKGREADPEERVAGDRERAASEMRALRAEAGHRGEDIEALVSRVEEERRRQALEANPYRDKPEAALREEYWDEQGRIEDGAGVMAGDDGAWGASRTLAGIAEPIIGDDQVDLHPAPGPGDETPAGPDPDEAAFGGSGPEARPVTAEDEKPDRVPEAEVKLEDKPGPGAAQLDLEDEIGVTGGMVPRGGVGGSEGTEVLHDGREDAAGGEEVPSEPAAPPEPHPPAIVEPAAEAQPESGPTPAPAGSVSSDPLRPYAGLKDNPYRDKPEAALREEYWDEKGRIGVHESCLARPQAYKKHDMARQEIEAGEARQALRREAAEARGIELEPGKRRRRGRAKGRGGGLGE